MPILNYHEMHTIFVGGIAMGSNEPLGAPSPPTAEYGTDSQEFETIIIDGPEKSSPTPGGKGREVGWLRMSSMPSAA
jgi:hypothetical protein